ncbi:Fur family transcriptional regulator [Desulfonatronum lacustre]|uniref:Fur family transcriptional regulator n=1 Tax=Desulfonatronum lacustre TaxID=66849 RepID=UPI00048EAD64|nr:transcriptional repressor [Desulfonatronum lacustre]SMP48925.1 Fur family transcriptional regulator, ferric uptake regulator [Desulfonatronum zhilinae]
MPKSNPRLTPQRRIILEELRGTRTHPTADEVYDLVRKRLSHVSLGTIYRNLEFLHSQGLIRKLDKIGSQMRFDAFVDPHLHVCCVECGKVGDLPSDAASVVMRRDPALEAESEFRITGHWLELYGICADCMTARENG